MDDILFKIRYVKENHGKPTLVLCVPEKYVPRVGVPKLKSQKFQNVFHFSSMEKAGIHLHFSAATYDFFRNILVCIVEEDTLHHIVSR